MGMELMMFPHAYPMESKAVEEATSGLQSLENLIRLLSNAKSPNNNNNINNANSSSSVEFTTDCRAAESKFKNVISILGRTRVGHARFRRAPLIPPVHCPTPIQQIPPLADHKDALNFSPRASSFISSLTADSKQPASSSVGKPPLSTTTSSLKIRICTSSDNFGSAHCAAAASSSARCHCSKKRKLKVKRVVRVPAISLKLADIPPDDYSWRKYGQKPIKGSPHPRGYYKCSSVRGCPARKHVERAADDPAMLVVTYEGEHSHNNNTTHSIPETTNLILHSS